jgi:hypothetical protein
MDKVQSRAASQGPLVFGLLAGAAGLAATAAITHRRGRAGQSADTGSAAFRSYLADHLTASDAALAVVTRLGESQPAGPEADLFARLRREFTQEQAIAEELVRRLGGSAFKLRRVVGKATGAVLQAAAGGEPGDLALFRTLESLAIGVQGKRLLWRAARRLALPSPAHTTFNALEVQAMNQWHHIEDCRLALVSRTFADVDLRS